MGIEHLSCNQPNVMALMYSRNLPALIAGKIDRGRHVRKRSHFLNFCTRKKIFKWQEIDFKESWPYDISAFILHKSRTHE